MEWQDGLGLFTCPLVNCEVEGKRETYPATLWHPSKEGTRGGGY